MLFPAHSRRGFTLIELLIAVAITSVVLLVLISLTGVVADSWRNGSNKIFTNNEARAGFNRLAEDMENAVIRDTIPKAIWLAARKNDADFSGLSDEQKPGNQTWLMFYTTPTDRTLSLPGNVITVSYKIVPQDPVQKTPTVGQSDFMLYGLYRAFPEGDNPAKVTFDDALGTTSPTDPSKAEPKLATFWDAHLKETTDPKNFYISNIFDFSFTFWATVTEGAVQKTIVLPRGQEVYQTSEGLWTTKAPTSSGTPDYPNGKLAAVDISMTILTREGARMLRNNEIPGNDMKKFLASPGNARTFSHKVYFTPEVTRTFQ